MPDLAPLLTALGEASAYLTPDAARGWTDPELLSAQRSLADARRRLDAAAAVVAGEIAYRSRRELGHSGLAAGFGQRTAEGLISTLTGTSTRDARTLVKAAELLPTGPAGALGDGEPVGGDASSEGRPTVPAPRRPLWLQALGVAVVSGALSVEQVDVIRTRLGAVTGAADLEAAARAGAYRPDGPADAPAGAMGARLAVLDRALQEAVDRLAARASSLTVEQLAVGAAAERDDLDLAGVAARERELRDRRYLRVSTQLDGMTRIHGLLDPESAAIVVPVFDAATSPRRGGPRFVDPSAEARADDLVRDERTTDQVTLDTLVDLVRIGARVDDGRLLGDRKPAVRILVTKADLEAPLDDDGRALNLGREQRLFSEKQRIVLAARDGGCLMCDRPPSWCEAHHIDHWDEHRGRTDVDDGVLLCRHCHLLLHNRRWRIRRTGADYRLERPDGDGILRSVALPSRSLALQRLRATG